MKIEKYRDLTLLHIKESTLTVACDSLGGIGALEYDTVETDGFTVGYHTAFVALAETLAVGSKPILVTDSLSVALDSYGKSILKGIKAAAEDAGMDTDGSITGSSEENFKPLSTGIGITVIGQLPEGWTPPSPTEDTYDAVVLGLPFVGDDVRRNKKSILTLKSIVDVIQSDNVLELIPAGSKGLLYEANQLADTLGFIFNERASDPDMIRKSAGPATCAVAAVRKGSSEILSEITGKPVTLIGSFDK